MTRRVHVPLPLALAMLGLAPLGMLLAPQDVGNQGSKIATVDLRKVFDSDAALKEDLNRIYVRKGEIEAELGKMREAYNELRMGWESIADRSSEKYVRAGAQVFAKEEEIKKFKVGIESFLEQEGGRLNLAAVQRYKDAIAQIASKRGLDVVLRITESDAKERSLEARLQAAELGMVLYREPKLDITDELIKFLKASK